MESGSFTWALRWKLQMLCRKSWALVLGRLQDDEHSIIESSTYLAVCSKVALSEVMLTNVFTL